MNSSPYLTLLVLLVMAGTGACGNQAPTPTSPASASDRPVAAEPLSAAPRAGSGELPDDFPLASGWPDEDMVEPDGSFGLHGPGRDRRPLRFSACGEDAPDPRWTDRLLAEWTNAEDFRARQVTTYADSAAATDAVAAFTDFWRACPEDPGDDQTVADEPWSTAIDVRPGEAGEDAWAVVRAELYDGHPGVGLEVLLVVRVGRAVLIDTAASEGGGGPDREHDIDRQIESQVEGSSIVVEAMCAYVEGGCLP